MLKKILAHKVDEVRRRQMQVPRATFTPRSGGVRDFQTALKKPGISIIAEVKRRSPSGGNIRRNLDPGELARDYEQAGATAISVLTDETYFGGSLEDLEKVRAEVSLPVLRKDFIINEYQVHESFHAGADAILLIADALTDETLHRLEQTARSLELH
ncbi:MAG: indole-3-glycerol-phosphate synthase, partial [Fidelibacterota bacterium]